MGTFRLKEQNATKCRGKSKKRRQREEWKEGSGNAESKGMKGTRPEARTVITLTKRGG